MNAEAVLVLPPSATVEALERAWMEQSDEKQPDALVLDMSECRFIEASSLAYILGRLRARAGHHLSTSFRLPRAATSTDQLVGSGGGAAHSPVGPLTADPGSNEPATDLVRARRVRDTLRDYHFDRAVRRVTGEAFKRLVPHEDHEFFGEGLQSNPPDETLPSDFFPFRVFDDKSTRLDRSLAQREADRWTEDPYVLRVLNRHLAAKDLGRRVATHIVNEAVMNAIRHPKASQIFTACRYDRAGRHLTILIYDDGDSVLNTLARAVRDGYKVRATTTPSLDRRYEVAVEHVELGTAEVVHDDEFELKSDHVLATDSTDAQILSAAFLPGITRDPDRDDGDTDTHPDAIDDNPDFAGPGMGLSVLLNSAADVFKGQVSLRSGNYFMNAKASRKKDVDYRIKVRQYPRVAGLFDGNLLTIRLPLDA